MVTKISYYPYVVCKYAISGKEYSSEMVAGCGTTSPGEAQSVLLDQFPVGKNIDFLL